MLEVAYSSWCWTGAALFGAPLLHFLFDKHKEFEAWYLGDLDVIRAAYPEAKDNVLNGYINDSIVGTWELLAEAIYKGGQKALTKKGRQTVGEEKSKWAESISPYMDIERNASPSFIHMREQLRQIMLLAN